jgi:uncharacterized tellurite resistance protein B-like protein
MSSITELLPAGLAPSPADLDVFLELAYLVTAVDGRLTDEELGAFADLAAHLQSKDALGTDEVDALVGRYAQNVDEAEIEARVREIGGQLPQGLREIAYKVSLGLAFVDHDPSVAEDRLHAVLAEVLGISRERREALSREVSLSGGKA